MKEKDNLKIKEDYLKKIKLLKKYDKYYYSNNNPLVDDSTYDKIKNYVLSSYVSCSNTYNYIVS